jgi:hypothetical protein
MPQREPVYDDFVELFPPTTAGRVGAAQAAGYGTARSVRGNREKTRRRRSFMRNMQRHEAGERRQRRKPPETLGTRESGIVRAQWKREARPHTVRGVLELMNRWGATVTELDLVFDYDQDERLRKLGFAVGIKPEVLRGAGFLIDYIRENPIPWEYLAGTFLLAYGRAYGMGDLGIAGSDDVEELRLRVGYTDAAQYDFGSPSRPKGAKRVKEKSKYKSGRWGMAS